MNSLSAARDRHHCVGIWFDLLHTKKAMKSMGDEAFCKGVLYPYYDLVLQSYPHNGGSSKVVCFGDTVYVQIRPALFDSGVPSPVDVYKKIIGTWPSLQLYAIVSHGEVLGKPELIPPLAMNLDAFGSNPSGPPDRQVLANLASMWEFGLSKPLSISKKVEDIAGQQGWGPGVYYQDGVEHSFRTPLQPSGTTRTIGSLVIHDAVL